MRLLMHIENVDHPFSWWETDGYRRYLADMLDKPKRWYQYETQLIWQNLIYMILLNVTCLYSIMAFPYWSQWPLLIWGFVVGYSSMLGITAGVHRHWSHNAFKAKTSLKIFLAICYYTTGQDRIYNWARNHRLHHKYLMTDADPHDYRRGFWFSHFGWKTMHKRPEVSKRDAEIDMSDISKDTVVRFFDGNYYALSVLFTFILPVFIPVYLFNQSLQWAIMSQIFMRYPIVLNFMWFTISINNHLGDCAYNNLIAPCDNKWINYLTLGDGCQNFHHSFPHDYRGSESHVSFNPTAMWINIFESMGLAYDLQTASKEQINKIVETKGDDSHPILKRSGVNTNSTYFSMLGVKL